MASVYNFVHVADPIKFAKILWPHVYFYSNQRDMIYSFVENDETVVGAANMLGKDFVAAFLSLYFFLTRSPCRIITTSASDDHLETLWGEIGRFIQDAKHPLENHKGGPLIVNVQHIRKVFMSGSKRGEECPLSFFKGMVANEQHIAKMGGHHIAQTGDRVPRTAFFCDEASSVRDEYKAIVDPWANREFIFGNTWPCHNFFYKALEGDPATGSKGGDVPRDNGEGFHRKVFRLTCEDSPNVRYARQEIAAGKEPSGKVIVPGVKPWDELQKNLKMWNPYQQSVSLYAQFYRGKEFLMFPHDWLLASRNRAIALAVLRVKREAQSMGVDPAQGGDSSVWTVVDHFGVIKQISMKTPDTTVIPNTTIALIHEYGLNPQKVMFDLGDGKQHVDTLRDRGYNVSGVGFGQAPSLTPKRGLRQLKERIEVREEKFAYLNRRAEMYHLLRQYIDPSNEDGSFAIPAEYGELHRQLAPIPLLYDRDGKIRMLPKDKKDKDSKEVTLKELLGCSPDEADSLVLAVFGLEQRVRPTAGAIG